MDEQNGRKQKEKKTPLNEKKKNRREIFERNKKKQNIGNRE